MMGKFKSVKINWLGTKRVLLECEAVCSQGICHTFLERRNNNQTLAEVESQPRFFAFAHFSLPGRNSIGVPAIWLNGNQDQRLLPYCGNCYPTKFPGKKWAYIYSSPEPTKRCDPVSGDVCRAGWHWWMWLRSAGTWPSRYLAVELDISSPSSVAPTALHHKGKASVTKLPSGQTESRSVLWSQIPIQGENRRRRKIVLSVLPKSQSTSLTFPWVRTEGLC